MRFGMLIVIGIGVLFIIVGWKGTQNKIANVLWGAQLTPFGTPAGCPPGFGQGTCPTGQCEIDLVTGKHCIPAGSSQHSNTSIQTTNNLQMATL